LFILFGCQPDGSSQVDENSEKDESSQVNEPTITKDDQETEDVEGKEKKNHRIVATTVAITEIMEKLELDLVGVPTSYKDLPGRYMDATEIGNPMWPDMEILMSLDPTDVLSVTTLKEDLETDFEK